MKADNKGLRFNDGKVQVSLVPPEAILALAEHYTKGAQKYAPRNWERGMDWSKCYDSLQRHALAWQAGEDRDPENNAHHMIAVAWNAIALFIYALRNIGVDDRAKSGNGQAEALNAPQEPHSEGLEDPEVSGA